VDKLFADLGPRFSRPTGRLYAHPAHDAAAGDSAPMALMQLVDGPAAEEPAAASKDGSTKAKRAKGATEKSTAKKSAAKKKEGGCGARR